MDDDIVYFILNGKKVSNDPRWLAQQSADAASEILETVPNTGHAGIPDEDMNAQIGVGLAPGQSGQEGVGPSPTASPEDMARGVVSGSVIQTGDSALARAAGFDPMNPELAPPDTPDSNEAVREARDKAAKAAAALVESGEEPGDPDVPKSKWSPKQLKAEVLKRNAERDEDDQIDLTGVKKKSQLVDLLEADDAAQS